MPALHTIAITLGDPAGVGPEVVAKTLRDPRLPKGFRFQVLGEARDAKPGKLTRTGARVALKALTEAAEGCRSGKFAAMVTGPVHKEALARIQPDFVGQTEFLARACDLPDAAAVMCLTDPKLTVALCSNHCSLRDALKRLTPKRIVYVAKVTREFLQRSGLARPGRALAFAGVNPHLGEAGLFGARRLRNRRKCHPRPADHPHVARPRHGARDRRQKPRRPPQHARRRPARVPVGEKGINHQGHKGRKLKKLSSAPLLCSL
jgi:4-hydroxy-L-threonine phosphate dehydrogenase PdxA